MQLIVNFFLYPMVWLISILPFRLLYLCSDIACFFIHKILRYRVAIVRKNLRLTFPDKSEAELKTIENKFYHHFCDTFMEMIKTVSISKKELERRFKFTNLEVLKKYETNHQSIMIVLGHYANWEWVMSLGNYIKHEGFGVYTPLANKHIDKIIRKIRLRHNGHLISKYDTVRTMLRHRAEKRLALYGLISDQSPQVQHAHYWTQFLGINVPVYAGAEIMAKKFDAAVVFMYVEKRKRGFYEVHFKEISDNPKELPNYEITERYNRILEQQIRNEPAYYLWTHNRFKHKDKMPVKKPAKATTTQEVV